MRIPSAVATFLAALLAAFVVLGGPTLADEYTEEEDWGDADSSEEDGLEATRDGWYAGANYVRGIEMWYPHEPGSVSNTNGLSIRAGWRFLENWALGFQYEWVDEFELDTPAFKANGHTFTFNGRYFVPFGRIQPYGLFGLGYIQSTREGSFDKAFAGSTGNFATRMGGGIDWYLTRNWVLATEAVYVLPTSNLNPIQYLSVGVGLQYRFEPHIY